MLRNPRNFDSSESDESLSTPYQKWHSVEVTRGLEMVKRAELEEESGLPLSLRELEYCPTANRNSDILLSGWLAVKTSGGWTRKWTVRHVVVTNRMLWIYKKAPPVNIDLSNHVGPSITASQAASVIDQKSISGIQALFGEYRDSVPLDSSTAVINVDGLKNTFQISYPGRPRFLIRASTPSEMLRWSNIIRLSCALAKYRIGAVPPSRLSSSIPHIDEYVSNFVDKATLLSSIHITVDSTLDANQRKSIKQKLPLPLVVAENVTYCSPVNIAVPPPHSFASSRVSLTFGDGGSLSLPLSLLQEKSTGSGSSGGLITHGALEGYSHGLFALFNSGYNAQVHLAWKFNSTALNTSDVSSENLSHLYLHSDIANLILSNVKSGNLNNTSSTQSPVPSSQRSSASSPSFPLPSTDALTKDDVLILVSVGIFIATLPGSLSYDSYYGTLTLVAGLILAAAVIIIIMGKGAYIHKDEVKKYLARSNTSNLSKSVESSEQSSISPSISSQSHNQAESDILPISSLSLVLIRMVDKHVPEDLVILGGEPIITDSAYPSLPSTITPTPPVVPLEAVILKTKRKIRLANESESSPNEGTMEFLNIDDLLDDIDDVSDSEVTSPIPSSSSKTAQVKLEKKEVESVDPLVGNIYREKWGAWSQSDYRPLSLRGPNYLTDRKKIPATSQKFECVMCQVVAVNDTSFHAASLPNSYYFREKQRAIDLGRGNEWGPGSPLKFLVVNMLVPGNPKYNFIMYFKNKYIYPSPFAEDIVNNVQQEYHSSSPNTPACVYPDEPFFKGMQMFLDGDDEYKTNTFKYIPNVAAGSFIVRKAVGQTPVIMGKKLTQTYYNGEDGQYCEVDIDVGSSAIAGKILALVKGYAASISVELNFLVEGQEPTTLPEALWGGVRIMYVDLNAIQPVDLAVTGGISFPEEADV